MKSRWQTGLAWLTAFAVVGGMVGDVLGAGRGGGGGGRAGGGGSRGGGMSGSGSVRYSGGGSSAKRAPSRAAPPSRPSTPSRTAPVQRPATPSRPASASRPASRPAVPATRPAAVRTGDRSVSISHDNGPSGVGLAAVGVAAGVAAAAGAAPTREGARASEYAGVSQRPANAGSITRPATTFVPGSIDGRRISQLPAGGIRGSWTGPGGGTVGGIRGPGGGGAVGVRGPGGNTRWVTNLPDGSHQIHHGGRIYWYHDHHYYYPYWYGNTWYYEPVPPPTGVYWEDLPAGYETNVIGNVTYYVNAEGVYLMPDNGQYKVVDPPPGAPTDPDPLALLRRMTEYIAAQSEFSIQAVEAVEEVLDTGAKAQFENTRTIRVRRPDKLATETQSERGARRMAFQGGELTVVDAAKGGYVTLKMPPTIDGLLDAAAEQYGISILLGDLLYSEAYPRLTAAVREAQYVGRSTDPADCHHLAFFQDTLQWEIWIDAGEKPLPRKLLLTYTSLPGSPRYQAVVSAWDATPGPADAFALKIPGDVRKIEVNQPAPSGAGQP